jgi:hypothetical protein
MQRVLTSYSQYHNRKYKKIGHLFQGRYKSILCQSDRYLGELVRYIHLNPVRAEMVKRPEDYHYSGHRAYLGLDGSGLVDTEPLLRHFGAKKKRAIEVYTTFVEMSLDQKSQDEYYRATEGRLLGSEEFLDEIRHRVGEYRPARASFDRISVEDLLSAGARSSGLSREELCSKSKNRGTILAKEAVIVVGRERGITNRELADALGIDPSAVTRRVEAARARKAEGPQVVRLRKALGAKRRGIKSQRRQA